MDNPTVAVRGLRQTGTPLFRNDRLMRMHLTSANAEVSRAAAGRAGVLEQRRREEAFKIKPYRPASDVLKDGAWAGERCFIVGGGPSLAGFDFDRLRGAGRVIAVNRAFEFAPFADVLFFMDNRFYQYVKTGKLNGALKKWNDFPGIKVFLNILGRQFEDVYSVRSMGRVGLSNSLARGLYHGNNSGVGALGLAYALGADPVYLLGFDFCYLGGKTHFHSGYAGPMAERTVQSFVRDFERMNRYISRTGIRVYNLSPVSRLGCFQRMSVDEVL